MRRNPQEIADLVTFTEEILNEKLHFLTCLENLAFNLCEGVTFLHLSMGKQLYSQGQLRE